MAVYRTAAVVLAALAVLAGALALVLDHDGWDTALGGVTGASTALAAGCLLGMALERRRRRDEADAVALDRLEPLHPARRDGA